VVEELRACLVPESLELGLNFPTLLWP
jgi:hypothetical protein